MPRKYLALHSMKNKRKPTSRANRARESVKKRAVGRPINEKQWVEDALSPAINAVYAQSRIFADSERVMRNPGAFVEELRRIGDQVSVGDLSRPEHVAMTQVTTLDILFNRLVALGMDNLQTKHFDSIMKLAFKAQSQCARTLETIAKLKHPAIYAKQVNMAQQQVVNNDPIWDAPAKSTGDEEAQELGEPLLKCSPPIVCSAPTEIVREVVGENTGGDLALKTEII
jgi:hypothetical protein